MKQFLLLFALLTTSLFEAQEGQNFHVKWNLESKRVSECEYDLIFKADIENDWHLYSLIKTTGDGAPNPTTFKFTKPDGYELVGPVKESQTKTDFDKDMELTTIYHEKKATFTQRIKLTAAGKIKVKGAYEFQTCSHGQCVFPLPEKFNFELDGGSGCAVANNIQKLSSSTACVCDTESILAMHSKKIAPIEVVKNDMPQISQAPTATAQGDCNPWSTLLIGLGFGLGAVLMPCVYSLIPLTVSFFLKQSKSRAAGIKNSLLYGFFIIFIFVGLTMIITVAFGPAALSNIATNTWLNLFFFLLFVVFALSFFGLFEITLPSSWANKVDAKADKGGTLGIFFMALTLVIVSFSCTVGFMGTLINAVASGDSYLCPLMGFTGFGSGIALPFMLFAFFPSWLKSLPKSGGWMTTFKVTVAFLELGLAIKFLANADNVNEWGFITREVFIASWVGISAMTTFYLLGAFRTAHDDPSGPLSIGRILWATLFMSFTIYLIPGLWGAPLKLISSFPPPHHYAESPNNPWHPAHVASSKALTGTNRELSALEEKRIQGPDGLLIFKDDLESARRYSKMVNKPLFIDFTGLACVNCRKMETTVWVKPQIKKMLEEDVVIVSLYVDSKVDLPESEQREVNFYGGLHTMMTLGDKWKFFQDSAYKNISQPLYAVVNDRQQTISKGAIGFEPDDKLFEAWLSAAVADYKKSRQ